MNNWRTLVKPLCESERKCVSSGNAESQKKQSGRKTKARVYRSTSDEVPATATSTSEGTASPHWRSTQSSGRRWTSVWAVPPHAGAGTPVGPKHQDGAPLGASGGAFMSDDEDNGVGRGDIPERRQPPSTAIWMRKGRPQRTQPVRARSPNPYKHVRP